MQTVSLQASAQIKIKRRQCAGAIRDTYEAF